MKIIKSMNDNAIKITTKIIRVYGIVQGVGFRPTVSRHAATTGIRGSVCNCGPYVEIIAQGTEEETTSFLELLKNEPPQRAAILRIDVKDAANPAIYDSFEIIESAKTKGEIFISPDIAICDTCREEMFDPNNRRYLHPFINCTCCGPRLTILDSLPYDRERTSMAEFPMCDDCRDEYESPDSRRYDAQPVCCPDCGPEVYELPLDTPLEMIGKDGILTSPHGLTGPAAISRAREIIAGGGIVAVKGIGGYHLCCDATDSGAVEELRERKKRPVKPFAVMAKDIETARRECYVEDFQEEVLTGHQKPIVLLKKRSARPQICEAAAPGNPKLGIMLPYAPLQLLLFEYDDQISMPDCLIMTSANASGAPICRDDRDALKELSGLCDFILSNDRKIRIRADDTVMDFYDKKPYMIRRSRGYAPLPFMVEPEFPEMENLEASKMEKSDMAEMEETSALKSVLAIGGELKNSFCISTGTLYYPSPYVGDLADLRTVRALEETAGRFETLLETQPQIIACDLHPGYNSTSIAERMAAEAGVPLVRIQHHYAHILSCMAENDCAGPVLGLAFDGTGYGEDKSIWGGELLLADTHGYRRLASIVPFDQCGGDASAREGYRIAASMLLGLAEKGMIGKTGIPGAAHAAGADATKLAAEGDPLSEAIKLAELLGVADEKTMRMTAMMRSRSINTVKSTSAGRLFDAVSAILGICRASSFEGEAAMKLQYAAEAWRDSNGPEPGLPYDVKFDEGNLLYIRTDLIVKDIIDGFLAGCGAAQMAYYFHWRLARETVKICKLTREKLESSFAMEKLEDSLAGGKAESSTEISTINKVAISGGVFQNTLLLDLTVKGLEAEGFEVLTHSMVPPNDGGISLGQALYATQNL